MTTFNRNELTHAVIWPVGENPATQLVDPDGEVVALVPVTKPVKGSEISKMIPDGFSIDVGSCYVVNMSGEVLVATVGEFDTAVVTERPQPTFEERFQRLELRERRREKREQQREAEFLKWKAERDAQEVVEPEPAPAPEPAPEPAPAPEPTAEPQEVTE